MSSHGSRSARIVSRTAFRPMSGNPLSKDMFTPSASSTESAPEVVSRRTNKRPLSLRGAVSTSRRQVDDEVDEVAVSCGDLVSQITSEECMRIVRTYGLYLTEPTNLERAHTPFYRSCDSVRDLYSVRSDFPSEPIFRRGPLMLWTNGLLDHT